MDICFCICKVARMYDLHAQQIGLDPRRIEVDHSPDPWHDARPHPKVLLALLCLGTTCLHVYAVYMHILRHCTYKKTC